MGKFEALINKDNLNRFSSEDTKDLLATLERLKTKKNELEESLDGYDFEDRVNLENDKEQTARDIQAIEDEINRRIVRNN